MVNIFDPEIIVLGGGVSRAHGFMKYAEKAMAQNWTGKHSARLVLSKSPEKSAILGAAELVFSPIKTNK